MKKYILFLLMAGMTSIAVNSQVKHQTYMPKGKNQLVSFTASLPVARYADSHFAGAGLSYSWSNHRFGDSVNARKWIGFTAVAGFDYFLGKKVTVAGNSFRYGNNLYVQLMPGIMYNPSPKMNVSLVAGPSLGIYRSSSSLALGVQLSGAYHVNPRISVGPSVVYRKHADVDALWTTGIRAGYAL